MAYTYRLAALLVLLTATVVFSSAMMDEQPFRPSSINNISLNIVWYGKFTPIQRAVIVDFIRSLNSPSDAKGPSVASWWKTTEKYKGGASKIVLEPASFCVDRFGSGAYPGYPGRVLVDKTTGASYNALGLAGRKYLLPAMWDPQAAECRTLV
ncbi:BnaAnng05840D [Brassica napus]|uniref:BnaAnng05840D protein n=1 Tax=Brassica napus TaxID=3708 RepID=A0A078HSK9_BRANA|nr:BnaAnng05840D [Brassica napus]